MQNKGIRLSWIMAEAVFDSSDRVGEVQLPPELEGKSAQEIAAHYQARERAILAAGNPQQAPDVTREQYDNDPLAATQRMIDANSVSRAEWNQLTTAAQKTLVETAKNNAKQGKKYWDRLAPEIEAAIAKCDPAAQMDSSLWTMAYNEALGRNLATIQSEEAAAELSRQSASAEGVSNGSTAPEVPRILSSRELQICEGLNITPDQFRRGEKNLAVNKFPVTLDNRRS